MGIITLRDYPNQVLYFDLPEVENNPIKINIHMVRIYNDGETILSIIKMKIEDKNYYYTSVSSDAEWSSPARTGSYYGYLIRRNDDENTKNYEADSQKTKQRIENIFKKLNQYDERLPKEFYKGGFNTQNHNGLRIFDSKVKGGQKKDGGHILKGGSRFFHVGKYHYHSIGCEGLGLRIKYSIDENLFAVLDTRDATADFLNNIIKVYEDNVTKKEQSTIQIDIEVEDNIQENLSKNDYLNPKDKYTALYPPRKKVKAIDIKSRGIKTQ